MDGVVSFLFSLSRYIIFSSYSMLIVLLRRSLMVLGLSLLVASLDGEVKIRELSLFIF